MDAVNAPTVTIGNATAGTLTTGAFNNWEHTLSTLNLISGNSITVGGNITKGVDDGSVANSGNGTLTLQSNGNIAVNAGISSSATYGQLNMAFTAGANSNTGGISLNGNLASNTGTVTLTAGGTGTITETSGDSIATSTLNMTSGTGAVGTSGANIVTSASTLSVNTSGGNAYLTDTNTGTSTLNASNLSTGGINVIFRRAVDTRRECHRRVCQYEPHR